MNKRTTATDEASAPSAAPFPYGDYVQARSDLERAASVGAFYGLLTGVSGSGKTSLVRDVAATLDKRRHHVVYLSSSGASLLGVTRFLAQALHVTPRRSYLETVSVLADAIRAHPARVLVWIDEADRVEPHTLAEIRVLAECDLSPEQLFSVVLSGLPSLTSTLDAPALFPVKRRISVRAVLTGLRRDELDGFLVHRFGSSDARRLAASLRDEILERSQGTPALVDKVVRGALSRSGAGPVSADQLRASLDAAAI